MVAPKFGASGLGLYFQSSNGSEVPLVVGVSFETASASVIKNGVEPRDLLCCSIKAIDEVGADRPPPLPMSLEFLSICGHLRSNNSQRLMSGSWVKSGNALRRFPLPPKPEINRVNERPKSISGSPRVGYRRRLKQHRHAPRPAPRTHEPAV